MLSNIFDDIITMKYEDVIDNLLTISKIKPYDKLYNNETKIFIEDSYIPQITRMLRGSNRNSSIKFIKYILTQAFFHYEMLKKCSDPHSIFLNKSLLNGLKNTLVGLENLKLTYSFDIETCRMIDTNIKYMKKFFP
jgi:hypothetical protein